MATVKTGKGPPADMPAHVSGIKQGNSKGNYEKNGGHRPDGTRDSSASTGVNPEGRRPIDPSMPSLTPG